MQHGGMISLLKCYLCIIYSRQITYKHNEFALGHTFGAQHTSISMALYNGRSLYQATVCHEKIFRNIFEDFSIKSHCYK